MKVTVRISKSELIKVLHLPDKSKLFPLNPQEPEAVVTVEFDSNVEDLKK